MKEYLILNLLLMIELDLLLNYLLKNMILLKLKMYLIQLLMLILYMLIYFEIIFWVLLFFFLCHLHFFLCLNLENFHFQFRLYLTHLIGFLFHLIHFHLLYFECLLLSLVLDFLLYLLNQVLLIYFFLDLNKKYLFNY